MSEEQYGPPKPKVRKVKDAREMALKLDDIAAFFRASSVSIVKKSMKIMAEKTAAHITKTISEQKSPYGKKWELTKGEHGRGPERPIRQWAPGARSDRLQGLEFSIKLEAPFAVFHERGAFRRGMGPLTKSESNYLARQARSAKYVQKYLVKIGQSNAYKARAGTSSGVGWHLPKRQSLPWKNLPTKLSKAIFAAILNQIGVDFFKVIGK